MQPPRGSGRRGPLRVAVLDHTAELGGAELALVRLLEGLDADRVEPVVVLFSEGPLARRLRSAGHAVEVVPLGERLGAASRRLTPVGAAKAALSSVGFLRRLLTRLRRLDVDLVHTTSLKADLIGVPVARLLGVPLVWHVHDRIADDYLPRWTTRLVRALARRAPRAVVANSAATATTLPGARGLTVIHPGLTTDQVTPAPRCRQPDGPPVVGMVGRLSPTKGQLVLVRAMRRVVDERPDATARLVGAAAFGAEAYEREVREEVERLGLRDHVQLVGFVDDPRAELDRFAVCVHASPTPEPFGQVVTEAMAWGVPVVATSGGGVDEVVRTGPPGCETGLLVPADDDAALATAILEVIEHPAPALARAGRAHADVRERFAAAAGSSAMTAVWESAAAERSPRRAAAPVSRPRVAIAHDYLTQRGGAERVVLALHRA
ncbi:MAG: glycosyltransferase family 4 protein, partial [Dermatophilaceae bacterium]|nr:glycosyltransferase family 4 protein [Dermatophilaceae bacterium]